MIHRLIALFVVLISCQMLHAQITLDEYSREVLAYSHELRDRELATEGARSTELAAHKGYLPLFSLMREMNLDFRQPEVGRRWNWYMRLDVTQPIFRGGAVRAEAKQASFAYDMAEMEEESVQLFVLYTAEVTYWTLSRRESDLKAMTDYTNIVSSLRNVVRERYNEGYISKSDLLQVESRLMDAEYQLSQAVQRRDVALHDFNILRGAEPTSEVLLAESILDSRVMPVRASLEDVLSLHPDYARSHLGTEHAWWGIRATRAHYLPQIEVGTFGLMQPPQPHVKGGGTRLDGGILVSFSTPIFHFGERKHAVSAARSDYLRSVVAKDDVRDRVTLDESKGWTNLTLSYRRMLTADESLAIARENLEISTYSYTEGLTTILDVLQAQLSWLQIYTNAITAQYDYAVAVAAYEYITCRQLEVSN